MDTKKVLRVVDVETITVGDRVRKAPGKDLTALAESLASQGQIQPIVVQDGTLIVGFRRLCAVAWLKGEGRSVKDLDPGQIFVIEKKDLGALDLLLIEFDENKQRRDFSKAEEALSIARIKAEFEKLEGQPMGQRRLAKVLDYSKAHISIALQVAASVTEGNTDALKSKTIRGAYRDLKNKEKIAELMEKADEREKEQKAQGVAVTEYHKLLYNGKAEDFLARVQANTFDLINFDPPWGIGIDKYDREENYGTFDDSSETGITMAKALIPELFRTAATDSYTIVWFGIQYYQFLWDLLNVAGFKVNPVPYLWHKPNKAGSQNDPTRTVMNVWEPFFVCQKGSPRMFVRGGVNLLAYDMPRGTDRIHYAQKSVDLQKDIIQRFSFGSMRVMDPTFGSGSFLIAAKALGRQFTGCEKDKTNYENAIKWLRRSE